MTQLYVHCVRAPLGWKCKCGNTVPDDRNFCVQCDREKPLGW